MQACGLGSSRVGHGRGHDAARARVLLRALDVQVQQLRLQHSKQLSVTKQVKVRRGCSSVVRHRSHKPMVRGSNLALAAFFSSLGKAIYFHFLCPHSSILNGYQRQRR